MRLRDAVLNVLFWMFLVGLIGAVAAVYGGWLEIK